jgi:preprotein translocase subunit SecF
LAQINIIFEISAIVLFGMVGDLIATWFTNAPILLWYWEKKHGNLTESG